MVDSKEKYKFDLGVKGLNHFNLDSFFPRNIHHQGFQNKPVTDKALQAT